MRISDWSSDVCSSDLRDARGRLAQFDQLRAQLRLPGIGATEYQACFRAAVIELHQRGVDAVGAGAGDQAEVEGSRHVRIVGAPHGRDGALPGKTHRAHGALLQAQPFFDPGFPALAPRLPFAYAPTTAQLI